MHFVDLKRRFHELTDAEQEDTELLVSLSAYEFGPTIGWPDLLEHARVIVLAEAGAGKTREMEEQAKHLEKEGRFAFFVRLEELVDGEPLASVLCPLDKRRFEAWKADGTSLSWFFLDAVDELKLTGGKLDRALRRFSAAIDGHIHRARVIISCRPSDWRSSLDLSTVEQRLPVVVEPGDTSSPSAAQVFIEALRHDQDREPCSGQAKAEPSDPDRVRVVFMVPMNDPQIRLFAEQSDLADANAFLQEVQQQNARAFAGRPLDLAELIVTWKSLGRLGTRQEQHETNVTARLKDDPDRLDHGVLTDVKARTGAERLALALALTRTRSIRSPEQALDTDRADGVVDAAEILPDWTEAERKTLLRRALFDPATYGRVRFHHRSVQEYLAARHLWTLREQGMSTKALLRLLFAERYGVEVVFPSMRAIAAWLALWNDAARKELIKREPEALLSLGDPESLDLATRGDLLRRFVALYGQGSRRGFSIGIDQLRRLAHPDLAPAIRECWGNGPVNDDVRDLLVRTIWSGPVPDCADLAQSVVFDTSWSDYDRIVAVRALVACSRDSVVRKVADDMLARPESWPDRIVHGVAASLFPGILAVDELITLMERTPEPKNTVGGFEWTSREIVEELDPLCELAVSLRDKLTILVWKGRADTQRFHRIPGRFDHIAPALAMLCERQLSGAPGRHDVAVVRCCVIAFRFCSDNVTARESLGKMKEHFSANSALRRAAFWAELAFVDDVGSAEDDWYRFRHSLHGSVIGRLIEIDRPWLMEALVDESRPKRRAVALHAVIDLWRQRGGIRSELEPIRAELKGDKKLGRLLEERIARRKRSNKKIGRMDRKDRRRELVQARRKARRLDDWEKWRDELLADPVKAFSPEKRGATVSTLYVWLSEYKKGSNRWDIWDKDALTRAFSQEIADLAEKALRKLWREETPVLWAEGPAAARNQMPPMQWIHGLLGVSAEASTPGWTASLSSNEARAATVYATIELGGFAPFIADLAKSHPAEVKDVIGGEVSAEIRVGGDRQYLPALEGLIGADRELKRILVPRLIDELKSWPSIVTDETGSPPGRSLDSVLTVLGEMTNTADRRVVAEECRRRYEADPVGPLAFVWLKGLFRFDVLLGTRVLTETLVDRDDPDTRKRAVEIFAALFGERDAVFFEIKDSAQYARVLGQLVRLSHAFVRPKDDQVHEGAYSPDARDNAQRVRGFLLSSLLDTPGPEARSVVLDLVGEDDFADIQDYIRLRARQRTAEDAEFAPLTPKAVFDEIENRHEAAPQDRDGLFDVMMDRLDDLAYEIDHHDFTNRETVRSITVEPEMQRTLALRLEGRANGAYHVAREEEVVDRKHTDITLSAVKGNQKAVVEVKIADKWSLTELDQALQNQLAGQYLRHSRCKAGCLLLTHHGRKSYWIHPDNGKRLTFSAAVEYLKDKAQTLEKLSDFRIAAFGLDLTDPASRP